MSTNLRDHLQALHDQFGTLTPELVVETARDPKHPLHDRFDWDDTIAAQKWRLEQAGQLLRVTYRPDPSKPTDLRAFVAIKGSDSHRSTYVPTEEALADDFTRQIVLNAMAREWKSLKKRYEHMAEFAELIRRDIEGKAS